MQLMMFRIVFLLTILFPTLSAAMSINQMFVFGDSLSDDGNAYNTAQFPPSPPYDQKFSNGAVAVEQLATMLGINLQPSTNGGTDYAYGGAATGPVPGTGNGNGSNIPDYDNYLVLSKSLSLLNDTGIQNQINKASGVSFDPNHSLFVLWGGANNIFTWLDGFSSKTIGEVITSAISNIIQSITTLEGYGAKDFMIPNMGDLGKTPFGNQLSPALQSGLSQITNTFNTELNMSLDKIVGATIFRPDFNNLLQLVQANPAAYGFTNATEACFDSSNFSLCQNPDNYLFWDGVHPTQKADTLIAQEFFASVIPEPPVIALMGLVVLIGYRRFFDTVQRQAYLAA